jgi:transposase
MTSGIEARGRFGKQDFVYLSDEDVYRCPAGERLKYYYTNEEKGARSCGATGRMRAVTARSSLHDQHATVHHALGA